MNVTSKLCAGLIFSRHLSRLMHPPQSGQTESVHIVFASSPEWPDQKCSYCLCILPRVARPKVSILSLSLSLSWTSPFVPFHQSPPVHHCATFEPTSFIFTFKPCQFTITSCTVVERWSLTSKLSLSRTLPAADG